MWVCMFVFCMQEHWISLAISIVHLLSRKKKHLMCFFFVCVSYYLFIKIAFNIIVTHKFFFFHFYAHKWEFVAIFVPNSIHNSVSEKVNIDRNECERHNSHPLFWMLWKWIRCSHLVDFFFHLEFFFIILKVYLCVTWFLLVISLPLSFYMYILWYVPVLYVVFFFVHSQRQHQRHS